DLTKPFDRSWATPRLLAYMAEPLEQQARDEIVSSCSGRIIGAAIELKPTFKEAARKAVGEKEKRLSMPMPPDRRAEVEKLRNLLLNKTDVMCDYVADEVHREVFVPHGHYMAVTRAPSLEEIFARMADAARWGFVAASVLRTLMQIERHHSGIAR